MLPVPALGQPRKPFRVRRSGQMLPAPNKRPDCIHDFSSIGLPTIVGLQRERTRMAQALLILAPIRRQPCEKVVKATVMCIEGAGLEDKFVQFLAGRFVERLPSGFNME